MREDDRSRGKFAEELLDAALPNHRGAEPEDGLEDRVLANMRRQARAGRPASWNSAPLIIAAVIVSALFVVDHLRPRPNASDPSVVDAPGVAARPNSGASVASGPRPIAGEGAGEGVKIAKVFAAASTFRRRDLALNLNSRREDERVESGLRIEETWISEIRLDDIVIGNGERRE